MADKDLKFSIYSQNITDLGADYPFTVMMNVT